MHNPQGQLDMKKKLKLVKYFFWMERGEVRNPINLCLETRLSSPPVCWPP